MPASSDGELIGRVERGSREAAEELFDRHWRSAWRVAMAVTGRADLAEDAAQDGFERVFCHLHRFDRSRPFAPWLHRIVANRSLDLLRRERRLTTLEPESLVDATWRDAAGEDRELLDAVAVLPPQRRAVVVLRYGLGYTPTEIGQMLDLPVGTVNSRLARALDQLRAHSEGEHAS
jgi:RNA polymerase sigma-70 factor (ECF subfamily)